MLKTQSVQVDGERVLVSPVYGPAEEHVFATGAEARGRAAIVREALSWIGTPFLDCADVKGPKGGVDCAMLCTRVFVDTGRLAPFDPRPYSPDLMRHSPEEKCLEWVQDKLGAKEVENPRLGDVSVWHFGQCHSHFGIVINSREIVNAYKRARIVMAVPTDTDLLKFIYTHTGRIPRPVKHFDVWSS